MKQDSKSEIFSAYLRDSIQLLHSVIRQYYAGESIYYRVAALQLRLLLCDSIHRHNRLEDISLLPMIIPDCTLPLISTEGIPVKGDGLSLSEWLKQPVCGRDGESISIRDFIRRVCDQDGGAHVDPKPVAGIGSFPNRENIIIQIAEAVCSSVDKELRQIDGS